MGSLEVNFLDIKWDFYKYLTVYYFFFTIYFCKFSGTKLVWESITSWVGIEWVAKHVIAMEREQICWFSLQSLWVFGRQITFKFCAKASKKRDPVVRRVKSVVQRLALLSDRPGDLQTEKDWEASLALQWKPPRVVLSDVVLTSLFFSPKEIDQEHF